jgi:hypothetical protein
MMGPMLRSRPRRAVVAALALLALAASCTRDEPTTPGSSPEVLAFEAPLLDGGTFRGEDLAGTDVAFWFWAPW